MGKIITSETHLGDGRRIVYAEEADAAVVTALKAEHPQYGLRFLPMHREWWVVWYWDANDPRRKHRQDMGLPFNPDAHSLIGPLPKDCSPDEAAAYVRNHFQINPSRDDQQKSVEKIQEANAAREQEIMDRALDDVMNRVELSAKGLSEQFSEGAEDTAEVGEFQPLTKKELRDIQERMREESKS